jgi:hypothetical protein
MIGIKVYDKMDMELPAIGMIEAEDSETGGQTIGWIQAITWCARTTNNISLTRRSNVKAFSKKPDAISCICGRTKTTLKSCNAFSSAVTGRDNT